MTESYAKLLSRNDLGLTGSHQAGICVPRTNRGLINFFPELNINEVNPDTWIECIDPDGKIWKMRYIYYNGKRHGVSTRDEYRITYMTKFFRVWCATEHSSVAFTSTDKPKTFRIAIEGPAKTDSVRTEVSKSNLQRAVILTKWRKIH
jgi:hypothetical protein